MKTAAHPFFFASLFLLGLFFTACTPKGRQAMNDDQIQENETVMEKKDPVNESGYFVNSAGDTIYYVNKSDEEWRRELGEEEYRILRHAGTERAFTGMYYDNHDKGVYRCAGCGLPLFSSDAKYDSGSGWPSYYAPIDEKHILEIPDDSYGMKRIELRCARCGGHLGHVFPDGPKPTGLRYCINSASLAFEKKKEGESEE